MNETTSFKKAPADRSETVIDKVIKWIFYAIAFAFLLWPALFLIGIIIAVGVAILAILFALSVLLIPAAIVLRLLRLV